LDLVCHLDLQLVAIGNPLPNLFFQGVPKQLFATTVSIIRFISSKIRNNHTRINNWSFC
jgi:hypothetical protein